MSKITAVIQDNKLYINRERKKQSQNDHQEIDLNALRHGKAYKSKVKITNDDDKNKLFLLEEIDIDSIKEYEIDINNQDNEELINEEEKDENNFEEHVDDVENESSEEVSGEIPEEIITKYVVLVYSNKKEIYYMLSTEKAAYKKLIRIKSRGITVGLGRKGISISVLAYIINKYDLPIIEQKFCLTDTLAHDSNLKIYPRQLRKRDVLLKNRIVKYKFSMAEILNDESKINNSVHFSINVNGVEFKYNVGIRNKKGKKKRMYYVPLKTLYYKDFALNIRRTARGNLMFIKRFKEEIENSIKFRIYESKIVSKILYLEGSIKQKISRKKVNLLYEKFSSKAEEGVYELCGRMQESRKSKNYFIIDPTSEDYNRIKNQKFVVAKYSFKYYRLLYRANNVITTEAPMHINILRSNNKNLRKSIYKKKFIFLQHGIIFMKNLGVNSSFIKGREAEPDYMIVSSEKEKDVVTDMLNLKEEKLLNTGIAIFSQIKHKHINNSSDDFITIMLTWKPYEEYLYDFKESTYYKNTLKLIEVISKYVPREKISIIPHPKVLELLSGTNLNEQIYTGPISKSLEKTKLLITDYSSVCYNSFYQGAGVIFYQEDLEMYEQENGELIPDEDEYIGERVFSPEELEQLLSKCIKNQKINLSIVRTKEHEEIYKTINEFSDGKNLDRIYDELVNLNLI